MKVKCFAALAAALALPLASSAAVLYSNDFSTDTTASWTVNNGTATGDYIADFYYDYSAIGVPAAPGGGTRGLKMTANNSSGIFTGFSASPTGQSFTGDYKVEFDMWQNYAGPLGDGGNGTTQLSTFALGLSDTTAFWPGAATKPLVGFGATLDGGSATDYRAYSSAAPSAYATGHAVYAPATSNNDSNSYYVSNFPSVSAPAAQVALFPGQTGSTNAGEISFKWRHNVIEVLDGFATWTVDGVQIAKVNMAGLTLSGSNIAFGHSDTNTGASTEPNRTLLNVTLIDNIVVSQIIPEPTTMALVAMGCGLAAAARRRV